jgi:hypothetical protein
MIKVKIKRKNYLENQEGFIAGFVAKQDSTYAIVVINGAFIDFMLHEIKLVSASD